jgi:serine/threonine-protein kinase HipA
LPLKLLAGKHHSKAYPSVAELHDFGRRVCGVSQPAHIIDRIAQAMQQTLEADRQDARIPPPLRAAMRDAWAQGPSYAGPPHG